MQRAVVRSSICVLLLLVLAATLPAPSFAGSRASSAILLIGDGMGSAHVRLGALVKGEPLAIQQLPFSGTATTEEAQGLVTDSAAAGTALATGHKTNDGMVGVSPDGARLESILERCQRLGKSTGIITTDALTGATPASFYAHVDDRGEHADIAEQLAASGVPVLLGFWKMWLAPDYMGGKRQDRQDLVTKMRRDGYGIVFTSEGLTRATEPKLLGMFDDDYGQIAPTLADLVRAALARLEGNPAGFLLVVEGARIDWRSHGNSPAGMLRELLAFDDAVRAALDYAGSRPGTLVVVTADHETGGLAITDPDRVSVLRGIEVAEEHMAWYVLEDRSNLREVLAEYAGLGDVTDTEIEDLVRADNIVDALSVLLSERAGIVWETTGHTSTPVGVHACGPGGERLAGEMDNTDIPKRMAEALGIGALPAPALSITPTRELVAP